MHFIGHILAVTSPRLFLLMTSLLYSVDTPFLLVILLILVLPPFPLFWTIYTFLTSPLEGEISRQQNLVRLVEQYKKARA